MIRSHSRKADFTGHSFGMLTVLRFAGIKHSQRQWLCRCECGREKSVSSYGLRSGKVRSCGCGMPTGDYDLKGKIFGRLTVVGYAGINVHRQRDWLCRCECGNEKVIPAISLRQGKCRSCGCLQIDSMRAVGHGNLRHGMYGTPTYSVWQSMKGRCECPGINSYEYYGGRGISVCERWRIFDNFLADMGIRPSLNHTLDRIDNTKGYCLENCRWATKKEQAINRFTTVLVTHEGRTLTLTDWSRKLGISLPTIQRRHRRGLSAAQIVDPNLVTTSRTTLEEAGVKAFAALAAEEFATFGYWATIWNHLNGIANNKRPSPFKKLIEVAQMNQRHESRVANGGPAWQQ